MSRMRFVAGNPMARDGRGATPPAVRRRPSQTDASQARSRATTPYQPQPDALRINRVMPISPPNTHRLDDSRRLTIRQHRPRQIQRMSMEPRMARRAQRNPVQQILRQPRPQHPRNHMMKMPGPITTMPAITLTLRGQRPRINRTRTLRTTRRTAVHPLRRYRRHVPTTRHTHLVHHLARPNRAFQLSPRHTRTVLPTNRSHAKSYQTGPTCITHGWKRHAPPTVTHRTPAGRTISRENIGARKRRLLPSWRGALRVWGVGGSRARATRCDRARLGAWERGGQWTAQGRTSGAEPRDFVASRGRGQRAAPVVSDPVVLVGRCSRRPSRAWPVAARGASHGASS